MIGKAREDFQSGNYICFTSDLDWAPEIAIEMTLKLFIDNEIRPTVFVTHPSDVIDKYREKIDLGIHPNFIQPSSQGSDIDEVISYCMRLVPDAKVFRAHRWYANNDVYDRLLDSGIVYESNMCTNMDVVPPFIHRSGMIGFPVFFEDGAYIIHSKNIDFELVKDKFMQNGLKVINIHPMHYALNTPYFKYTRQIKDRLSREDWNKMDAMQLEDLQYKGFGITNFIESMIRFVKVNNVKIITLEQAYMLCTEGVCYD